MSRDQLLGLLVPALLVAAVPARAQTGGLELTVFAGPNYSWLAGSGVKDAVGRVGLSLGLRLHQPIGGNWSVDPEIGFAYKGANSSGQNAAIPGAVVNARLWYMQFPIPMRFTVASAGKFRPRLWLGPYIAIRAGCTAELEAEGILTSQSCSDLHPLTDSTQTFDPFKSWDGGFVAGVGWSIPILKVRFDFDLRYEHGLLNISRLSGAAYNRSVLFGVGVPF